MNHQDRLDQMRVAANDEDFVRCMTYITLREQGPQMAMKDIATHFEVDYTTLRRWVIEWDKTHLLQKCRMVLMVPIVEDITATNLRALTEWGEIFDRQLQTAKSGKSDKTSLEAAMWLYDAFVHPALEERENPGAAELAYIEQIESQIDPFNPLAISEGGPETLLEVIDGVAVESKDTDPPHPGADEHDQTARPLSGPE